MELKESGQMYLETILILSHKLPIVRSLDVAEYMNYSAPSVCRAVGILKKKNYLIVNAEGSLTLTESGKEIACKIYERHTLLTQLLIRLGVNETIAAEDACKMEHDISDASFDAIKRHFSMKAHL